MNIWLLIDNKKEGPLHDFEVRSMISDGNLEKGTMAWYEGMPEWKPIEQLPLFEDAFHEDAFQDAESQEDAPEVVTSSNVDAYLNKLSKEEKEASGQPLRTTPEGEPIPTLHDGIIGLFILRRLMARFLDFFVIVSGLILFIMLFAKANPITYFQSEKGLWIILATFFIYEVGFLYTWGTTVGKALLGLRTESFTGNNLPLIAVSLRTIIVLLFMLFSLSHPLMFLLNVGLCIFFIVKKQICPWDAYGRSHSRGLKLTISRIAGAICLFIALNLMVNFFTPESVRQEQNKFWEEFQK